MRITSLFSLNAIALDVAASNQDEIIDKVVELQSTHNNILDRSEEHTSELQSLV